MRCADAAMYEAKRRGKHVWCRFDAIMQAELEQTLRLESELRAAVLDSDDAQLHLHYQPQIDIASGKFIGVEALLRWQHPELGRVSPERFVAIARTKRPDRQPRRARARGGLLAVGALAGGGGWARCAWRSTSPRVSSRSVTCAREVEHALRTASMPPEALEVELTESCMIEAPEEVIATLQRLRKLGVRVAMDDFGNGHSSLGALLELPIDTLKIDSELRLRTDAGRAEGAHRADRADAGEDARARGGGRGGRDRGGARLPERLWLRTWRRGT